MNSTTLRLGLSFIVGLGCWFGKVEAQQPAATPASPQVATPATLPSTEAPVVSDEAVSTTRFGARVLQPVRAVAQAPANMVHHTGDWLREHKYLCGQNLDWYGCGGWRAQNTFVFGSCRTFFGEPCLPREAGRIDNGGNGNGGCVFCK